MTEAEARALAERFYGDAKDLVGLPAIDHPRRVAERVSERAKVVAWLHDVIEDGLTDPWEATTGLSPAENGALWLLTRDTGDPPPATYEDYVRRIATAEGEAGEIAREVKLADLYENTTRRCPEWMLDMRKPGGRYPRAIYVLETAQRGDRS